MAHAMPTLTSDLETRINPAGAVESASGDDPTILEIVDLFREKLDIRLESPHADLFHSGVFDSMTLVTFILHLEEKYAIRFPMEDLDLEAGVTVATLAGLVNRSRDAAAEPSA